MEHGYPMLRHAMMVPLELALIVLPIAGMEVPTMLPRPSCSQSVEQALLYLSIREGFGKLAAIQALAILMVTAILFHLPAIQNGLRPLIGVIWTSLEL